MLVWSGKDKLSGPRDRQNWNIPQSRLISAILQMKEPTSITELCRFMGMVNQLGKFSSRIATISQPLHELLSKQTVWTWGHSQEAAFQAVKDELTKPSVLALYDPKALTKVSADASSYGLGAVLLQKLQEGWRPVAFASWSMSEVEQRYAQIEKEALACTWATAKFANYFIGMNFTVETDCKPLIPLRSTKQLSSLRTSKSFEIQTTYGQVQFQYQPCTRKTFVYSRHTFKITCCQSWTKQCGFC